MDKIQNSGIDLTSKWTNKWIPITGWLSFTGAELHIAAWLRTRTQWQEVVLGSAVRKVMKFGIVGGTD